MWLISSVPGDPADYTAMEKHATEVQHFAEITTMQAIQTEDRKSQMDAAHQMIQIGKSWIIRKWSELKLGNRKPLVWIPTENAQLTDLWWTEYEEGKLKMLMERSISQGASRAGSVYSWLLACFLLVLAHTKNHNEDSGWWYDKWPLNTSGDWVRGSPLAPVLVHDELQQIDIRLLASNNGWHRFVKRHWVRHSHDY